MEINNSMKILMQISKIYKPVSQRASKYFFVAFDLVKINNMYQFTHEWFVGFFTKLVSETIIDDSTARKKEESIRKMQANFMRQFYLQVCQALFDQDKLLFSFLLAYKELEVEFKIDRRQVEFFIKGAIQQDDEVFHPKNLTDNTKTEAELLEEIEKDQEIARTRSEKIPWINTRQWKAIDKLSQIPPFNQPNLNNKEQCLAVHIEQNHEEWFRYINGNQLLDYTMARFTTKDEDGNSIHSSDEEEPSDKQKRKDSTMSPVHDKSLSKSKKSPRRNQSSSSSLSMHKDLNSPGINVRKFS